jgi:predicted Rossmann fold flavoprotein
MAKQKKVIVVGDGPAGLMAAGWAAQAGAEAIVLGKMDLPGNKLRLTGNGRCNLTNTAELTEFIHQFGKCGNFLRYAFSQFFNHDLIDFFNQLGVLTMTEEDGCVFTASGKAQDVVVALIKWVRKNWVQIRNLSPVANLIIKGGKVIGVQTNKEKIFGDAVVIATGGASYPATGSTGDGYKLAEAAGHKLTPIRPALVPLETVGDTAFRLQGVSLKYTVTKLLIDGKVKAESEREIIFTHYGLSGPAILSLSKQAVDAMNENKMVSISIDLRKRVGDAQLDKELAEFMHENGRKNLRTILKMLMPLKMADVFWIETGIQPTKKGSQITAQERKTIKKWLKELRFEVKGHRGFAEAMVTAGGVDLKQVDAHTMESRLVKGLYFAGEVLDIDGDTGGFNLQAAFSTGRLAGKSAGQL